MRDQRFFALVCVLAFAAASQADEFRPNLGPDRESITVHCGEIGLLLRRQSQWTPGRIDFRSTPMTTEKSAYGTVLSFPETGFIGTAHLENEPEDLKRLTFVLDGDELADPDEVLTGESFQMIRESQIRGFRLKCEFRIENNRLIETTTLATDKAVPLKLLYHFMHAWKPSMSELIAGVDDDPDKVISQQLLNDEDVNRKMYLNQRLDWMAIYDPESRQFAVSRLLQAPEIGEHEAKVWNVPGAYRKFYLMCFNNQTVPAGFEGTWRMITAFGAESQDHWAENARKLAETLNESHTVRGR
ncbi:MAG: hypothetical protein ACI8UO_005147 [Verrucomicrobiales bacterium]|jgi:hypothetical protein